MNSPIQLRYFDEERGDFVVVPELSEVKRTLKAKEKSVKRVEEISEWCEQWTRRQGILFFNMDRLVQQHLQRMRQSYKTKQTAICKNTDCLAPYFKVFEQELNRIHQQFEYLQAVFNQRINEIYKGRVDLIKRKSVLMAEPLKARKELNRNVTAIYKFATNICDINSKMESAIETSVKSDGSRTQIFQSTSAHEKRRCRHLASSTQQACRVFSETFTNSVQEIEAAAFRQADNIKHILAINWPEQQSKHSQITRRTDCASQRTIFDVVNRGDSEENNQPTVRDKKDEANNRNYDINYVGANSENNNNTNNNNNNNSNNDGILYYFFNHCGRKCRR